MGAEFIFDAKNTTTMRRVSAACLLFFVPILSHAQELQTVPVNAFLTTTIVALGLLTLVLMTLAPDGSETTTGPAETAHAFSGFSRIDVHGGVRLLVTQGPEFRVVARGSQAGVARLVVAQTSDTLRVRNRFGFWWGPRNVTLTVTLPELRELEASGACIVHLSGIDHPRSLRLEALGATVVKFSGRVERLRAEATGASRIQAEGTCQHLDAEAVGASTFAAFGLQAQTARVEAVGASNAEVFVVRELNAEAVGCSNVRYRGNPSVRPDAKGGSSVTRA